MKLLIYYNDKASFQELKFISKIINLDVEFDETNVQSDCLELFNNNNYDMVFVDFSEKETCSLVETILEQKPLQKLFLLSETFECLKEKKDCAFCKKHFNMATIVKPISQFQMAAIFNDSFECESCNKSLEEYETYKVIKYCSSKYPYLKFDNISHGFDLGKLVSNLRDSILVDLTQMMEINHINYTYNGQILKIDCS